MVVIKPSAKELFKELCEYTLETKVNDILGYMEMLEK